MHDEMKTRREELEKIASEYKYGFVTDAKEILDTLKNYREENDFTKLYRIYFDFLQ